MQNNMWKRLVEYRKIDKQSPEVAKPLLRRMGSDYMAKYHLTCSQIAQMSILCSK